MYKKTLISLALAASLVLPAMSTFAAATLTTIQFENSYTNITVDSGSVVDATVRFNLTSPTTVSAVQYEFVGSGEAPGYWNVEPDAINPGLNQYVEFPMNVPHHSGTWNLIVRLCGAALPGSDQNCHLTPVATHTYNGVVTTNPVIAVPVGTPLATPTPTPVVGSDWMTALQAQITALIAQMNSILHPSPTPTPSKPAVCVGLAAKVAGGSYGVYTSGNSALQHYLMDNGYSIPALNAGAAFGFFGSQTSAAVSAAQAACL